MTAPIAAIDGGVRLTLHVRPRAGTTEVQGLHGDAIKLRIAAPPIDGAANDEVIRFVAETLGVPRRDVTLTAGRSSRRKVVEVHGTTVAAARTRFLG